MTAFVDTNVLVRHLTGDPPAQARLATRYLKQVEQLLLPDLILAEVAYVLESYYEVARLQVAEALRAILAFRAIRVVDGPLLQSAVELYEVHGLEFANAYLVASAERTDVGVVASFDRGIDRVGTALPQVAFSRSSRRAAANPLRYDIAPTAEPASLEAT